MANTIANTILINGHDARDAPYGQDFVDQLLKAQLLQHRGDREQTTVGSKTLRLEVKVGGSCNFIGLRDSG
jgi:hypothetical protein